MPLSTTTAYTTHTLVAHTHAGDTTTDTPATVSPDAMTDADWPRVKLVRYTTTPSTIEAARKAARRTCLRRSERLDQEAARRAEEAYLARLQADDGE